MVERMGMNLKLPEIGTPAQDWARIINDNFSIIDYHNHTLNYGININADSLSFGDFDLNNNSIKHLSQLCFSATNDSAHEVYSLFVDSNFDLYFQNSNYIIQITLAGGLQTIGAPEGFTVTGSPPVAIFDGTVLGIRFLNATGLDTSTLLVHEINCNNFNATTLNTTSLSTDIKIVGDGYDSVLLKATFPGPVVTKINPSYNAWEAAPIYKLSENGVFYYDNLPVVDTNSYALSYFKGSKNWISSPNTVRSNKVGTRYYMKTVSFPITGLKVNQTFLLDNNLNNANLVSFIPKIKTTSAQAISQDNSILKTITLPTFEVLFTSNSVSVAVNLDFSSYSGTFTSLEIQFKIIYADKNYTIRN